MREQSRLLLRAIANRSGWLVPSAPRGSICDVPGIKVGHLTLERDTPFVARTGITAVVPDADLPSQRLPAAAVAFNGTGEMTGFHQLNEWGALETPVALTGTAAVGTVLQGLSDYMFQQSPALGDTQEPTLGVVAECDDMWLTDTRHPALQPQDVRRAIESAVTDQREWGSVGAGTGMVSFGFKGGVGSSSRLLRVGAEQHVVGCLCLVNFGRPGDLRLGGLPLGHLPGEIERDSQGRPPPSGSLVAVLATEAPLGHHQLKRIAQRCALGMARVGGQGAEGSGDLFLAFSSAAFASSPPASWRQQPVLRDDLLDSFFRAAVEATEEAIIKALLWAQEKTGLRGRRVAPLPAAEVLRRLAGAPAPEAPQPKW